MTVRKIVLSTALWMCGSTMSCIPAYAQCTHPTPGLTVASVSLKVSAAGLITATPDPLNLAGCGMNVHIEWAAPAGFAFHPGAVGIQNDPQHNFSNGFPGNHTTNPANPPANSPSYHWLDRNTDKLQHKYSIRLLNTRTGGSITVDPVIFNDG